MSYHTALRSTALACTVVGVFSTLAAADPIHLPVDADSYIRGASNADTNYGDEDILRVKRADWVGNSFKTYLRFDTSSLTEDVFEASLTLTIADPNGRYARFDFDVYGLKDVNAGVAGDGAPDDGGWIESGEDGLTWANAPANLNSPNGVSDDAVLLGTIRKGEGVGQVGDKISLSGEQGSSLVALLNDDTNGYVTFIIVRQELAEDAPGDENNPSLFTSREHTTLAGPELGVVVPEPGSLGLLGAGVIALFARPRCVSTSVR